VNVYYLAGFGLSVPAVTNAFSPGVDTSRYQISSPLEGKGSYKRLSLDLGIGAEQHFGGNIYGYTDVRTSIPTSGYPSPYLPNNNKFAPVMINAGIRILFTPFDY
jgi:hypothetical protein